MTDRRTEQERRNEGPIARDPLIPDEERIVIAPNEVRGARMTGRVRWVLAIGLVLVVIGFVLSYFVGRPG